MDEKVLAKLDELICEGEALTAQIKFVPHVPLIHESGMKMIDIRKYKVYKVDDPQKYENWRATSKRIIVENSPDELQNPSLKFDKIDLTYHQKILATLVSIKELPYLKQLNKEKDGININIKNTNTQSQELIISIFHEAINAELKGKELEEIRKILEAYKGRPEEAKPKIIERLKSFGGDVLSNVLANIITNPSVWKGFV